MVHRTWAGWICVLCLLLAPNVGSAAKPVAKQAPFTNALLESQVGTNPAQAYFLVGLLNTIGVLDDDVEVLRRELLHAYAEQLAGQAPMPAGNVAEALARGRDRGDVLDSQFVSRWQAAYNKGLEIRWADGDATTPYFASLSRGMRPIAPGIWAEESSTGKTYFKLGLRLFNKTSLPVPIHNPDLVWGAEPGTGRGGLGFSCSWDKPEVAQGSFKLDQVLLLEPGGTSDAIVCEAPPTGAYWKDKLRAAQEISQPGGLQPLLISHEFDSVSRQRFLELALGDLAPQSKDWRLRMQVADQEVGRQWVPAKLPLDAPEAKKWTMSPHAGWAEARQKLQWFLGASLITLALFAVGRALLNTGAPVIAVAIGTGAAGIGLMAVGMRGSGSGTGYDSPFYLSIALYATSVGPMLLSVWALHGLHRVLDEEDLSWWHTVARGWSRMLDLRSPTSRAEFLGFLAHCLWWWALVHICLQPLDLWLGAILLLAMGTLVVRRVGSMTPPELLALAIVVACLVLRASLRAG